MAAFAQTLPFSASRRNQRGWKTAVIFATPALLLFTLFIVLPVIDAAGASVYNWNGLRAPTWDKFIGFGNYIQLMGNKTFRSAVANTGLLIAASLFIQLPLGLAMATLLARRQWGTITFRMIFFLPFILADVAAGLIFHYIFDGDVGLVSLVSQNLGFGPVSMLAEKNQAIYAVMIAVLWKYFGFHMMLYIAGMQAIDRNLYEAAEIDGANAWQQFWHVTVPGIASTIRLSVFFAILGSLQFFDLIVPLTGGGPLNSSHTIVSFLYYFGIGRMRVGFGDAVGVTLFVVCVAVAFTYRRWVMRND
jgi:raffinose/stachyose/melibiose transport system permease protein